MYSKREETKEHIRKRILDAAYEEFAEKGYTKTKISEIAKRAECAAGVVNKYFDSKENLLVTLIHQKIISSMFTDTAEQNMDEALDYFLDGIKHAIRSDRTRAEFDRMLVSSTDLPFNALERFGELAEAKPLFNMLAQAQKRGDIPSAESPAGLLFGLYKGTVIISRWYKEMGLCMPENEALLFIIAYDRRAVRESRPTYFAEHPADY